MSRNDQLNSIRETLEEDRRIAIEQGMQQGKIQTARQFKLHGVAKEIIAEATGLSMEEVEAL